MLWGILGHAFTTDPDEVLKLAWNNEKQFLPSDVRALFSTNDLPFGFSSEQWGFFIGAISMAHPRVLQKALPMALSKNPAEQEALKNWVIEVTNEMGNDGVIYRPITCHEITSINNLDVALIDGELVGPMHPDFCSGIPFDRPYDSANYPIKAPIFYFQGEDDTATPLAQARYHFEHQVKTKRFFLGLPGVSHTLYANIRNCMSAIHQSIYKQGDGLEQVVKTCNGPVNLMIADGHTTPKSTQY